jgi:hypothetical protein
MTKYGHTFSKFSKEALEIGASVSAAILKKVRNVFDLNKGDDEVFRTKKDAPKIMTKFKDKPYSHELLPEYANGSKKFPTYGQVNELGGKVSYGEGYQRLHREHPRGSEMPKPAQHL